MEMIEFPSIGQFRNTVKALKLRATYAGRDEDDNPIYDSTKALPVVTFTGTVKLHGTNAGITFNSATGELWAQSRTRVITPENDNAGFAAFVQNQEGKIREMFRQIEPWFPNSTITLFGEWCGGNIQKGVAINGLEKMFVVFDMLVDGEWATNIDTIKTDPIWNMYRITEFPTYQVDIDFSDPDAIVNHLVDLTHSVEKKCPVGDFFHQQGVGEGIVWKTEFQGKVFRFKVKGEKHSASKVKKLATVDPEKLASIKEFVDYAVTENRLNQGIEQVFNGTNREPEIKLFGEFVKWINNDVFKEESDTLESSGLTAKDVVKSVNSKALTWFKLNYC